MAESITEFVTSAVSTVHTKSESTQSHLRGLRPPETPVLQNLNAHKRHEFYPTSYNSYIMCSFWGNCFQHQWMLGINPEGSE